MTGYKYLLDTVIVVGILNLDLTLKQRLENAEVYVSSVTIGELYFGAYGSKQMTQNLDKIHRFVEGNAVIPCEINIANHYGLIKQQLKSKGRPIPENDIWIAATAIQNSLILATRDKHFAEIDGLLLEVW